MKAKFLKCVMPAMLFAFLVTGCASVRWHKPQVSLVDVRLAGGNLQESRLALKLRVHNENDKDIVLDALSFDMLAGDFVLARGARTDPIVLARMSDTLVDINATAHTLDILRRLPLLVQSDGRINYVIRGEASIHDYGKLPFEHTDSLVMPKFLGGSSGYGAGGDAGTGSSASSSSANPLPQ